MMDVRFPITLTPKMPVPNITSAIAPMATKDNIK